MNRFIPPEPVCVTIPEPCHDIGDLVTHEFHGSGVIHSRTFDNLLHASEWRYVVDWESGKRTDHLYCGDMQRMQTGFTD